MASQRAVLDANVLFGALVRDLLLRLAEARLFGPIWTGQLLDEFTGSLLRARPDIGVDRIRAIRRDMEEFFPEAMTVPSRAHLEAVPDAINAGDRHVVAAAIAGRAGQIVTMNLRDFPVPPLNEIGLRPVSLDSFLHELLDRDGEAVMGVLRQMSGDYKRPPMTVLEILDALRETAPRFVDEVVRRLEDLGVETGV